MKILLLISLFLYISNADSADKQEVRPKTTSSPLLNTIQSQQQKYETFYQPKYHQIQQQLFQQQPAPVQYQQPLTTNPKYVPIQIVPKQYFAPQPQAIIIMAQPALLPSSVVYGNNPMQQLLNYFHNNPQAKYQLLYGSQYHQQPQATYLQQQVVSAPSPTGNYILGTPQNQQYHQYQQQLSPVSHPHLQYQQASNQIQSVPQYTTSSQQQYTQQPSSLGQLAQLAAQQYVSSTTQLKSAPAIVTGFENFTPEQQAQIKAQLNTHLGTNYHAVSTSPHQQSQYSSRYNAASNAISGGASADSESQQQESDSEEFVPSTEIKHEGGTTVMMGGDILKTRYSKGHQ